MKEMIENIFGFIYTLSMGDYIFFIGTFVTILAFIYVIYLMKKDEDKNEINDNSDISYLENIKNNIEKDYNPVYSNLTEYEKEQEDSAIISYEELIKNKDKFNFSYDEEYKSNDNEINVKKINIGNNSKDKVNNEKLDVKLLNYSEYEEFLVALKQLQKNLIN